MEEKTKALKNQSVRANEIRAQVNMIQEVMNSVMKKDIHYGIIPGCKKPSLLKPGAEKILMTFHLVADNPIIEDLSTNEYIRYRITQRILTPTGELMGAASGECSSDEDKYKWRRPVCDEEFKETSEDRRMEKWIKGEGKAIKIKRIRTNPADVGNTILKMAVKRAVVAATLITTAASDVFDQDIEDLPPEILNNNETPPSHKPPVAMPKEKEKEAFEDTAINVLEALKQPIGSTFDVWGVLFDYKSIVTKTKKDVTYYKINPRESTKILEVAKFGKLHEGVTNGDTLKFLGVTVSEYQKEKKYLAQEIELLEKGESETTE